MHVFLTDSLTTLPFANFNVVKEYGHIAINDGKLTFYTEILDDNGCVTDNVADAAIYNVDYISAVKSTEIAKYLNVESTSYDIVYEKNDVVIGVEKIGETYHYCKITFTTKR